MFRRALVVAVIAGAMALVAEAGQATAIALVVDGNQVATEVPPLLLQGRVLVPLRLVGERLGFVVRWDSQDRTITLRHADLIITLRVGSTLAIVQSGTRRREVGLDVAPRVVGGRVLVPIRFIAEALGARVTWDGTSRTVYVASSRGTGASAGTGATGGSGAGGASGGGGSSTGSAGGTVTAAIEVTVVAREFSFNPSTLQVAIGQPVRLVLRNQGREFHALMVSGVKIRVDGREERGLVLFAPAGLSSSVTFTALEAGTFEMTCPVSGHAERGMIGTLVVSP